MLRDWHFWGFFRKKRDNYILWEHKNGFFTGGQIESESPEIYIGRRKSSINVVSGMRFEMRDGQIVNVIIDLREEKNLRSDLVNVGGIKKPREQKVYPACFFRNMQSARIFYIFFHSNLKRVSWAFQVWRSEKHFERYITCCLWTYFLSFDILWENILSACGKVGWNKADYHIRQS